MATTTAVKPSVPKKLPPPNSDFYEFAESLPAEELAIVKKVRSYMETKVAPIIKSTGSRIRFRSSCSRRSRS